MTTKHDRYDAEYWEAAGMDADPRPGMLIAVLAFGATALVGLCLVAAVIREIVR